VGGIELNNRFYSYKDIQDGIDPDSMPEFACSAFQFCKEWLIGKKNFILRTSGSTGQPKVLEISRAQMEFSALATIEILGLKSGETALLCLPTSYIAGIMMLVRGMKADLHLILVAPGAHPFVELKEKIEIDFMALVPMQMQHLLSGNNKKDIEILKKCRNIIIGGAAIRQELEDRIRTQCSSSTNSIYVTYGMTETVSHIALRKLNTPESSAYYQALPNVQIAVDHRDCLRILSPVTNYEWLQTNDIVEIIDPNKFIWVGRADDIVNSGGVKIQPEVIEKKIEHFLFQNGMYDFQILPLPHPLLGEALTLFIEGKENKKINLPDNIRLLTEKFEMPKAILYIESFPRTSTGKPDKMNIKNKFQNYYTSLE
jgi:O-succinylbenzoic acid--CoA ligase